MVVFFNSGELKNEFDCGRLVSVPTDAERPFRSVGAAICRPQAAEHCPYDSIVAERHHN